MNYRKDRLVVIKNLIRENAVESQENLINLLKMKGFDVTQATLSRDMKYLKISKSPNDKGNYIYTLPIENNYADTLLLSKKRDSSIEFASIEFSGQLAVLKTRPGYASAVASDIDTKAQREIMGTIAGDDTVLIIPREGVVREEIIKVLSEFIQFK